ncbi:MAG: orotidine-5'-phosphate decarboxylase [Gammaproteobacteria bacterium]|nr:MAG: orotidine-5'-phosphate decarboxylase [Gammaproteobacteria bacterium]
MTDDAQGSAPAKGSASVAGGRATGAATRIIVALDYPNPRQALPLLDSLDGAECKLKIGKELFVRGGPQFVRQAAERGFDVFLDLKFHDIPNTVAQACSAAADLGVWMMNVHALGGKKMLEAARNALDKAGGSRPLLVAVTVLTSLDAHDLRQLGLMGSVEENVLRLARLAHAAGLDGVVCSPRETALLRGALGADFCLVTPGIRPSNSTADDQKRTLTPCEALQAGASYLVIGRPITRAPDPMQALRAIQSEIASLHTT